MPTIGSLTSSEMISGETYAPSGSTLLQLTSAPAFNSNIYCEMPFNDPDSRYVILQRSQTTYGPWDVWRADLQTRKLTNIADDVAWTLGCGMSSDQRYFYCVRPDLTQKVLTIIRTEITTLKQWSTTFHKVPGKLASMGALSLDGRYYYASSRIGEPREHRFGVVRFDLQDAEHEVIFEAGDDLCNAHVQIDPGQGKDLLIQHNRGSEWDDEGNMLKLIGPPWCTLFLIDTDGNNRRNLPVGNPYTGACQGHQAWIGGTGDIIFTIVPGLEPEFNEPGHLLFLHPGDEKYRVINADYDYAHPNASRDGRFFVSDTYKQRLVVVGSIKTGKCRVLCETGSTFRGNQWTHPHPYFTPDRKWVIFNSDRTGTPQVYAASVPEGLLEELE